VLSLTLPPLCLTPLHQSRSDELRTLRKHASDCAKVSAPPLTLHTHALHAVPPPSQCCPHSATQIMLRMQEQLIKFGMELHAIDALCDEADPEVNDDSGNDDDEDNDNDTA